MATFLPRDRLENETWLGLGEACRTLGVNESTLRRWADAALVRTFRTPGGHRRFLLADLHRLTDTGPDATPDSGPGLDGQALEEIRHRLEEDGATPPAWLEGITPEIRETLGALGRQLVAWVEEQLSRPLDNETNADGADSAAHDLGAHYARVLRDAGIGVADAVAAFAYFRRGMDEAVRAYARTRGLSAEDAGGLWEHAAVLHDQVLVALTSAYEGATSKGGRTP